MTIAERTAETRWTGNLAQGYGRVHASSGAFDALPVTWAARTKRSDGRTSPEELAAAAHSSCFLWPSPYGSGSARWLRTGSASVPP
jgi:osmotically inducible protein OsmC